MVKLPKIFKELLSITSKTDKESILEAHKDDEYFRELLKANLDPYRLFYIKKMPHTFEQLTTFDKFIEDTNYKMFMELLGRLEKREATGNKALDEVTNVFCRFDKFEYDMYKRILLKEAIGVGVRTVNKVYGKGFVPSFEVMLAPNELADVVNLKYPCFVQPKLDGFRCVYIPSKGSGQFFSRKGLPFGNKGLTEHFKALQRVSDHVLDGELYSHSVGFNKLQSILSAEDAEIPNDLRYIVYDGMPAGDWWHHNCKLSYSERLKLLRAVLNDEVADYTRIIDIPNDEVESPRDLKDWYKHYLDKGYEGVMIKKLDGKYQWKRVTSNSGEMLKLKPFKSVDVKISSIYAGEGLFEGKAGGIIFKYKNTEVRCGSGFDIATRDLMAKAPEKYVGKIVEVKYFEETPDNSLRFPTFMRFRGDK